MRGQRKGRAASHDSPGSGALYGRRQPGGKFEGRGGDGGSDADEATECRVCHPGPNLSTEVAAPVLRKIEGLRVTQAPQDQQEVAGSLLGQQGQQSDRAT